MKKVVSFDGHGTLFEEAPDHYRKIAQILNTEESIVRAAYSRIVSHRLRGYPELVSDDIIQTFWLSVYQEIAGFATAFRQTNLGKMILDYAMTKEAWVPKLLGVRFLKYASKLGFRCILCSEWDSWIAALLEHFGLNKLFDEMYITGLQGHAKWTPMFWSYVLSEEALSHPSRLLHVGNDPLTDEKIPRGLGIETFSIRASFMEFRVKLES